MVDKQSGCIRDWVKVKALLYLYQLHLILDAIKAGELDGEGDGDRGLPTGMVFATASDIAKYADVNLKSLRVLLGRWRSASWGYVAAIYIDKPGAKDGRPHWLYKLNAKGVAYIKRAPLWYSRYDEAYQVVCSKTDGNKEGGSYEFMGFPTEVTKVISWVPMGAVFEVCLVFPFVRDADVALFPTPEAIRLCSGKELKIIEDGSFVKVANAKEAIRECRSRFNIEPSEVYMQLALDKAKEAQSLTRAYAPYRH